MRASTLATIFALGIAGCGSGTPLAPGTAPGGASPRADSASQAPVEIELRFDETVDAQGLKLRWLEIQDSRCPIGVTCIWEGQVVVTLEVARGEERPVEVELIHQVGHEIQPARAFDHDISLLGVDPYPRDGVTPDRGDYVAHLRISGS